METKIAFPAMVKHYRLSHDLTMEQLAEQIGKTKSTISKWESGARSPKIYEIEEIAKFFGVEPNIMMFGEQSSTAPQNELLTAITDKVVQLTDPRKEIVLETATEQLEEQQAEEKEKTKTAKIIPLPKTHSDTIVEEAQELKTYTFYGQATSAGTGAFMEDIDEETIDLPVDIAADFVCPVDGNSMEPDYHDGDYIFIKQAFSLNDGDIGVFDYNGNAYVKQYRIKGTRAYLHSLNPKYKDMHPSGDDTIRIIGKVVGRYREG